MQRCSLAAILVFMLLVTRGISQVVPPNFSGTWRMNHERSRSSDRLAEDARLKIQQVGNEVLATLLVRSNGTYDLVKLHYVIGAKDFEGELHGGAMKSNARWDGTRLRIDSVVLYGEDPLRLNDQWSISDDGRTLTFQERHQFMDEAPGESTQVYDKQPDGSWQPPDENSPAESLYKNIQILKGVPAIGLPSVMNLFTKSLGVECTYCHVAGDFSKDDKAPKLAARRMLAMVQQINRDNFQDTKKVSCWTCHRGSTKPQTNPK